MSVSKTLFDPVLVTEVINKVKGKSSLATLSQQIPVAFTGNKEFVFSMDSDIDLVAESGAKGHGGITMESVTIMPVKVEYGARVSDEFMYASEEQKIEILQNFTDGFAKKVAAGLDKMAMHGINPRTGVVATNVTIPYFDNKVTQTVNYSATAIDDNIESAIALVEGSDGEVTGVAMSTTARTAMAAIEANGLKVYPEFMFGGRPENLGASALSINSTVNAPVKATSSASAAVVDHAIVGDFANMFRWGYGKDIYMDVIEYGDPDNTGSDLKGHNQVYIRCEAYIGWAIFDAASFARVIA